MQAIEVTQGVRADIPTRVPPTGSFDLPDDGAVHVANRNTFVRVYPWIEAGEAVTALALMTAELYASIDGGPEQGPLAPRPLFHLSRRALRIW